MEAGKLGGFLLGEVALGSELSKAKPEGTLGALDWLLKRRAETNLGRSVISGEAPANGHVGGVAESRHDMDQS